MKEEQYAEFIKGIELTDILLRKVEAIRPVSKYEGPLHVNLKTEFNVLSKETDIVCEADFSIIIGNTGAKDDSKLNLQYVITYKSSSDVPLDDQVEKQFLNTTVPLNIWPYAREMVSSMTTRMGLPPLIIGSYKIYR